MQRIGVIVTLALACALGAVPSARADDAAPGMPAWCDTVNDPTCLHALIPPPTEGSDTRDAAFVTRRAIARPPHTPRRLR